MQICMLFLILYFSMFFSICIFFFILYTFNCLFLSTLYMSVYSADCICQSGFISLFVLLFVCRLSAISYGCLSGYPFVCVFDCSGTLDLWSQRSAGTPTEPKLEQVKGRQTKKCCFNGPATNVPTPPLPPFDRLEIVFPKKCMTFYIFFFKAYTNIYNKWRERSEMN